MMKFFLKFVNVFSIFRYHSPLERVWHFILKNLNPLHPRMLCAKFGWNWPSGSGEEDENVKSLHQDRGSDGRRDRQTDDGQQAIKKAPLSFHPRWATKKHIQIKSKFWNVHWISLFDAILRSNQEWFSSHRENRNTSSWIMEWLLYMLTTCHCVGWPKRTCKDLKSIQSSANCMYVWANWF